MASASSASARSGLLLVVGYGLYKAVSSTGYLSAMGTAEGNLGFVSQLPFMMANCLAETVVSFALALLAVRGRLAPGRLPHGLGYALLALATLASAVSVPLATTLGPGASELAIPIALGLVKGAGSITVSLGWFERYVTRAGSRALWLLLGAFGVGAIGGLGLSALPNGIAAHVLSLGLYAVSFGCSLGLAWGRSARRAGGEANGGAGSAGSAGRCREDREGDEGSVPAQDFVRHLELGSAPGRRLVSVWLCLLVAQFVVGVTNTAVFESSFAPIMAQVNVNLCILVVVAALAVVLRLTRRMPRPQTAFGIVMPLLLAAFTMAALAAERFGVVTGYAMITCYEAIAVTYTIYLVTFLQEGRYELYRILGLASGTMSLALLLGLVLGVGLTVLCDIHDVPLFTLLAFVAIYPIGLALLWMQRTRERDGQAGDAASGAGGAEAGAGATGVTGAQAVGAQVAGAGVRAAGASTSVRAAGSAGPGVGAGVGAGVRAAGSGAGARSAGSSGECTTHADVEDYRADVTAQLARRFGLTPREAQVCERLARGHTVRGIAEELGITENTAWTHVRNTYAKCGVRTKQELIELFEATRP